MHMLINGQLDLSNFHPNLLIIYSSSIEIMRESGCISDASFQTYV